jgi:uncharacterized protein (TIRG00374 family)
LKRLFLSILITIGIIFVLFSQISLKDLYTLLKNADPFWILLGALAYLLGIFFRALRYKWLIHSKEIPLSDLFRISVFYNFSLMVLPSKLGELSYPYFLNRLCGMNMTEGLASLIASRVYDFFTILVIFLLGSIGFQSLFKINVFLIIVLVALLFGLTFFAFFYMSDLMKFFSNALGKISQRIGGKNSKLFQWTQRKIHEMAEDFCAIKARRTYLPVTVTSLVAWIMAFWMFYALLKGFGVSVPFSKVIFGSTVAIVANALPISGLGNWGILEAGWTAGFLLVGLSKVEAITTGFGVHIILFMTGAVTSLVCWVTINLPSHRHEQQSPSPNLPNSESQLGEGLSLNRKD